MMTKNETAFRAAAAVRGPNALDALGANAEELTRAFNEHILHSLAPDRHKKLRPFTPAEAADLLTMPVNTLRRLHWEGRIPDGIGLSQKRTTDEAAAEEVEGGEEEGKGKTPRITRKSYTAQEIIEIRHALAEGSRNPLQYLPGRTGDEPCQVIAFSTFKGGSGKTTSACHLAQRFALKGYRVLLIDMDPQASATTMMGNRRDFDITEDETIYAALRYEERRPMSAVALPTYFPNLDLAASASILQEFETETANALKEDVPEPFFTRLTTAIDSVQHKYDLVFIDCPPQLGFLTMTALSAANGLVIPVIPNMIDVASLKEFLAMAQAYMGRIREEIEETGATFHYDFLRYLLCRYEPQDGPQTQVSSFLRHVFPGQVMVNPFLKSTAIADAGITSDTIYEVAKSQMNRATLARAIESVNLVADELEQVVQQAWRRRT